MVNNQAEHDSAKDKLKRLESYAKEHPSQYHFQVRLFALLGTAYLLCIFILYLALASIGLKHLFPDLSWIQTEILISLGTIWQVFTFLRQSIFITIPLPQGVILNGQHFSTLFRTLNQLRAKAGNPPLKAVIISQDFNAAVLSVPTWGILGGKMQNYLILGLPLMSALSSLQLQAVICHEFGHLSGQIDRFYRWIYFQRLCLIRLLNALEDPQKNRFWLESLITQRFIKWYVPKFLQYTYVIARSSEYEADAYARKIMGSDLIGTALGQIELKQYYLLRFQKQTWDEAFLNSDTPNRYFTNLNNFIQQQSLDQKDVAKLLSRSLEYKTNFSDSHPSLSDRLKALDIDVRRIEKSLLSVPQLSSAEKFLGNDAIELSQYFDEIWMKQYSYLWYKAYSALSAQRTRFLFLKSRLERDELEEDEIVPFITLVEEFMGLDSTIPYLQSILNTNPQSPSANFYFGRMQLLKGDESGFSYFEKTIAQDNSYKPACDYYSYCFFDSQGKKDKAKYFEQEFKFYVKQQELKNKYQEEQHYRQRQLSNKDHFAPHDLNQLYLDILVKSLNNNQHIQSVFLARKIFHESDNFIYILLVKRTPTLMDFNFKHNDQILKDQLNKRLAFPGETIVLMENKETAIIAEAIKKVAGEPIYHKHH